MKYLLLNLTLAFFSISSFAEVSVCYENRAENPHKYIMHEDYEAVDFTAQDEEFNGCPKEISFGKRGMINLTRLKSTTTERCVYERNYRNDKVVYCIKH